MTGYQQNHRLRLEGIVTRLVLLMLLICSAAASAKPNIVLLLVDDAGFSDYGGYGGEANTPNINSLADRGIRFTNYHTSPLCAPSRAMLLTGLDNHKTGIATIPEVLTQTQSRESGYAMRLLPGVSTIADHLKAADYATYMTGKWHLGRGDGDLPDSHGFDRSFALDASGADNWEQKSFIPFYKEAPWFEDGQPADLPEDFYSSRFLVDKMIEYVDDRPPGKPFFAYVAFQAIHIPVQAPRQFTDRYQGVYSDGWQATLERRFARAQALGIVPADAVMPTMHPSLREWESLSSAEQAHYERSMMVNAGMLEAMDHHIGRLIEHLQNSGDLDNTVFIITSDNGPEFNDPATDALFQLWMSQNGYNNDLETLGERGSMGAIGPEWASVGSTPGSLFKFYASEGGTRVPLIISGPGIINAGFINPLNFVTDLTPTMAELAGIQGLSSLDGRSLMPLLTGSAEAVYPPDAPVGLEVAGNSALFKGHHKLTRNSLPHGDGQWRLHDIQRDPAESEDLSARLPQLRAQLLADYQRYADQVSVIELPADFDVQAQMNSNVRAKLIDNYLSNPVFVAALCLLLFIVLGGGYLVMRALRRR